MGEQQATHPCNDARDGRLVDHRGSAAAFKEAMGLQEAKFMHHTVFGDVRRKQPYVLQRLNPNAT